MRSERDERGAVAVVASITIVLLLVVAALAVDIGVQRVARSDMQALADVVALDLARELGDRDVDELTGAGVATGGALTIDSRDRNQDVVGYDSDDPPSLQVELGSWDASASEFTPMASGVPSAVRVTASTTIGFAFGQIADVESGDATRHAVATSAEPSVCFSIGTRTLTLNTSESGLGPILDHILSVNLSAVGYSGIADLKHAYVPIADLLLELNVGSYDELLTSNVSLAQFILAAANALEANGDTVNAELLRAITLGVGGFPVALADILALETGADTAGLTADVNVLDILGAAIVAANGENAVTATIPGTASVKIIEPPKIACGRAGVEAYTAQIRIKVDTTVPANPTLGLVGADVDLEVDIGRGRARLDAIGCSPLKADLTVTTGVVGVLPPVSPRNGQIAATVSTAKILDLLGGPLNPVRIAVNAVFGLVGINRIGIDVLVAAAIAGTTEQREAIFPEGTGLPETIVVPSGGLGQTLDLQQGAVTITSTGLVGALAGLLNPVLGVLVSGVVTPLVNNTVDPLLTSLLNPVLDLLGIKLGVAEVDMLSRPVCQAVRLAD